MGRYNKKLIYKLIAVALIVVCIVYVFYMTTLYEGFQSPQSSPFFTEAYAITLSKYPERFPKIKATADAAGITLKPWEGVLVKEGEIDKLPLLGIGTTNYTDRTKAKFNLGVIGAFLAHRNLLEHISKSNSDSVGTLIFEDDIDIPKDLYKKLADVQDQIPEDWDYIFFRKMTISGKKISANIIKLEKDMTGLKNWGFWGFIVKNSSIQDRILPKMEHMLDVPDIQMAKFADKLNMYLIDPPIIDFNEHAANSVVSDIDVN